MTTTLSITIEIPYERAYNCLVGALDFRSTIGYWAALEEVVLPDDFDARKLDWLDERERESFASGEVRNDYLAPLVEDGWLTLVEVDDDQPEVAEDDESDDDPPVAGVRHRFDLAAVKRGLEIMATKEPRHFGDLMACNDDATTHDVFVQCCVLGEVKYG